MFRSIVEPEGSAYRPEQRQGARSRLAMSALASRPYSSDIGVGASSSGGREAAGRTASRRALEEPPWTVLLASPFRNRLRSTQIKAVGLIAVPNVQATFWNSLTRIVDRTA